VPRCSKVACGTSDGLIHIVDVGAPRGAPGSSSGAGVTARTFATGPNSAVACIASPRASACTELPVGAFNVFASLHGGGDPSVRLWDARSSRDAQVASLRGHKGMALSGLVGSRNLLAFSPCARYLGVAAIDGAWIYDLRKLNAVARLDPRTGTEFNGPRASEDGVVGIEWVPTRPGVCLLTSRGVLSMWSP